MWFYTSYPGIVKIVWTLICFMLLMLSFNVIGAEGQTGTN